MVLYNFREYIVGIIQMIEFLQAALDNKSYVNEIKYKLDARMELKSKSGLIRYSIDTYRSLGLMAITA